MTITPFEMMLITSTILEFNPILQTIKIIKLKEAKDVSIWTYMIIFIIGVMWLVYSIQIDSLPLIIGNAIKIFASSTVIIVYMRYRKGRYSID
ncbi:SemiSWEET family transporter [Sulfurovum sp. zt1-1]|uniref:SemiSWEET family transporter n=1 Tax=Sulfurovum zhangzhouensis TaxID=3019067 RepID=A0ABT7QVK3_9BACT|nr:SemiSWEET family transporter [Sulfurovum zhangzhouensis]MDM5270870.1 SemiSWEET family transporter [Sulfurovum zhangzhouensis]